MDTSSQSSELNLPLEVDWHLPLRDHAWNRYTHLAHAAMTRTLCGRVDAGPVVQLTADSQPCVRCVARALQIYGERLK